VNDLDLVRSTRVATGRYQSWQPGHGVPVRITVGAPKFWGNRRQLADLRVVAPYGLMDPAIPTDECRQRYLARLEPRAGRIVADLARIARQHPGEQLVLLCFEDVSKDECHRTWLAEWLEEHYGIEVPELG
jgi:hypothetical protein